MTFVRSSCRLSILFSVIVIVVEAPAGELLTCWSPVAEQSHLTFEIKQADTPLKGEFKSYQALLCLQESDLKENIFESGRVSITIKPESVSTLLPELDRELKSADFFHTDRWQTASFQGNHIDRVGESRYKTYGKLTIRDITRNITIPFEFQIIEPGKTAKTRGALTLKRLDYDIGLGEWSDTRWVGNKVKIHFEAVLKRVDSRELTTE